MLNRMKKSLVESFVGAIALGYLLAQGIMHFAYIFSAPLARWMMRDEYRRFGEHVTTSASFLFKDAGIELARSFFLFLIWYILLRWLYLKPFKEEALDPAPNPEPPPLTPPAS